MAFFEQEIGVPYPWAKYYQVCVDDFGWGGMENTSLTTLNESTLHTAEFENLHLIEYLAAKIPLRFSMGDPGWRWKKLNFQPACQQAGI